MSEVIIMANSEIADDKEFLRKEIKFAQLIPAYMSYHIYLVNSCQGLVMILTSVPCIMICHDLDKDTMINHDLARFTMIMARVPWLRTLGSHSFYFPM